MATEDAVMAVIKASRPTHRHPHDQISFALHASFLASGYTLLATGNAAFSDTIYSSPPSDEVGIEGWNEKDDVYGFVYSKIEKGVKKTVLIKCLVMGDYLVIDALCSTHEDREISVQINVNDFTEENSGSSNYADRYKNFGKLVKTLNSEILSKMEDDMRKDTSGLSSSGSQTSHAAPSRMDAPRKYKYLDELGANLFLGWVRVRVLQRCSENGKPIDMILIDAKGNTINAKIRDIHAKMFGNTLKENQIYDIARFSMLLANRPYRPAKHDYVMFISPSAKIEEITDLPTIPIKRHVIFTKLSEAAKIVQRQDTTYLHDLMGVVVSWTKVKPCSANVLKRDITIQDTSETIIKITLWNEFAQLFDKLGVGEKSVFVLTSAAVNKYKDLPSEGFTTTRFSKMYVDDDTIQLAELRKSDKYATLEKGPELKDWRDKNRKTLYEVYEQFESTTQPTQTAPFTCIGKLRRHRDTILYTACKGCNTKNNEGTSTFYCKKCNDRVSTHPYFIVKLDLDDGTQTEVVTIFGNHVESILKIKANMVYEAHKNDAMDQLFGTIKNQEFVFELKPQVYSSEMTLSVTRMGHVVDADELLLDYETNIDSLDRRQERTTSAEEDTESLPPKTPIKNNVRKRTGGDLKMDKTKQTKLPLFWRRM